MNICFCDSDGCIYVLLGPARRHAPFDTRGLRGDHNCKTIPFCDVNKNRSINLVVVTPGTKSAIVGGRVGIFIILRLKNMSSLRVLADCELLQFPYVRGELGIT